MELNRIVTSEKCKWFLTEKRETVASFTDPSSTIESTTLNALFGACYDQREHLVWDESMKQRRVDAKEIILQVDDRIALPTTWKKWRNGCSKSQFVEKYRDWFQAAPPVDTTPCCSCAIL